MASKVRFPSNKAYLYTETYLVTQFNAIKSSYLSVRGGVKCGKLIVFINLKPTDNSIDYELKIEAKVGGRQAKIYVTDPVLTEVNIPHRYADGSLCLYYIGYDELRYGDKWADTLIPWASLWLFYYEIWKDTGIWKGGGIHPQVSAK